MTREHMVEDQRFASTRPDVLTYQTDELTEDVVLAGPLTPSLFVSTTGTDSDWVVKLIDVYPGRLSRSRPESDRHPHGRLPATGARRDLPRQIPQQLLQARALHARARWRRSSTRCRISTTAFRKGHRIMVQMQSSWFPLADRNPQKFLDINNAKASDFVKATQRVYRSAGAASCVKALSR